MKRFKQILGLTVILGLLFSCEKEELSVTHESLNLQLEEHQSKDHKPEKSNGFVHGIVIEVDQGDYYFAGAPDGEDGAFDIPGHYWVQAGNDKLVGKHYNTGPFGAEQWWSSDAENNAFLYKVDARIDEWTQEKAEKYASKGFIHYHELISVEDQSLHPYLVVWLKHIAVDFFTLDGGPHPEMSHEVRPGVDLEFIPNWNVPYDPTTNHD